MTQSQWTAVDQYFSDLLVESDPALQSALDSSQAANLPAIHVAPNQGKLLHLLARIQGARSILELGTLGAYSTIWLARALPPTGHLITLEADPKHAAIARANLARAGLAQIVELIEGRALDTLPQLLSASRGPFDLIFIDADKPNLPAYLEWSLKLSRPGTVIVADNVVRKGEVTNPASPDPSVQGVRRLMDLLSSHPRLTSTALQTVGTKGYDGFAISIVLPNP